MKTKSCKNCAVTITFDSVAQMREFDNDKRSHDVISQASSIVKKDLFRTRIFIFQNKEQTYDMYKRLQYILATRNIEPEEFFIGTFA